MACTPANSTRTRLVLHHSLAVLVSPAQHIHMKCPKKAWLGSYSHSQSRISCHDFGLVPGIKLTFPLLLTLHFSGRIIPKNIILPTSTQTKIKTQDHTSLPSHLETQVQPSGLQHLRTQATTGHSPTRRPQSRTGQLRPGGVKKMTVSCGDRPLSKKRNACGKNKEEMIRDAKSLT